MARCALTLLIPELARVLYGAWGSVGEPRSQPLLRPCSWPAFAQVSRLGEQGEPWLSSWSWQGLRGLEGEACMEGVYPQPALGAGILGKPHPWCECGCGAQKRREITHLWLFRECQWMVGMANAPRHVMRAPTVRPPLTRTPWVVKPVQPIPSPLGSGDDVWTALGGQQGDTSCCSSAIPGLTALCHLYPD